MQCRNMGPSMILAQGQATQRSLPPARPSLGTLGLCPVLNAPGASETCLPPTREATLSVSDAPREPKPSEEGLGPGIGLEIVSIISYINCN